MPKENLLRILTIGRYTALVLGLLTANFAKELHLPHGSWTVFLVMWIICFGGIMFLRSRK